MSESVSTDYPLDRAKARIVKAALENMPNYYLVPHIGLPDNSKDSRYNLLAAVASQIWPHDDPHTLTYAALEDTFTDLEVESIAYLVGGFVGHNGIASEETGTDRYDRVRKEIISWSGLDLYKQGDRVVVKAGSEIFSTKSSLVGPSKKDRTVSLNYAEVGFSGDQYGRYKTDPKVGWAGSGGYWCWTHPDNVSIVDLARKKEAISR